tara:strand:+ start:137 stop:991 length:855 start_codon:yes stop_codon:yes gene_type:complete
MEYDIVCCNDGVTRAVKVVNGTPQDPSLTSLKVVKEEKKKPEKPKISIQERIAEQISAFIGEIEGKIDDFVDSDYKVNYDFYSNFIDKGCKSVHARKLREYYLDEYNAMVDLYNGEDEYLNEAWGHLDTRSIKKFMDFYGIIVDDLERVIKNASAQRKPRKTKQKSASKLIKNLKYQVEFPDLKLVSINPEKIVGANELWVYNTKSNLLGVYYAENSVRGFSVKGCTIQHFDEQMSIQKTARKPKDVLGTLTKRSLKKKLKDMKTKDKPVTGRINAQTILLGAF